MRNQEHQEIRRAAASLAWLLSGELKSITAHNAICMTKGINGLAEAINYLLGIACDDWGCIKGTCEEIEQLDMTAHLSELSDHVCIRWSGFIEKIAYAEGRELPAVKVRKDTCQVSKEEFASFGVELGYVKRKSLLGRTRYSFTD